LKRDSKLASFIEVSLNTVTGLIVSTLITWKVMPLWGFHPAPWEAVGITLMYTAVSIIRGYIWRRTFVAYWKRNG